MSDRGARLRVGYAGLTWAVVCLLLAPLASGCTKATPTPEPATIVFAFPESDREYYQALVRKFNESFPTVTVKLRERRYNRIEEDADVFVDSALDLPGLLDQNSVLSLKPLIQQGEALDMADFYPGTVDLFTSRGETWAIPAGVDVMVMFYNKDLFDQYGVPYPQAGWTWDDFLSAAVAIRHPDADTYGYVPALSSYDPLPFIYQHGGRIFDDLQNPTRMTFDDPLTIEALDWYANLIFEYDVAPTPEQAVKVFGGGRDYAYYYGITRGKVGMWMGMFSERGGMGRTWPVKWEMRWGLVPLPRDVQTATEATAEGYYISSKTGYPDACWQWIVFLSEQIPSRLMPPRTSLAGSAAYEEQVSGEVAAAGQAALEEATLIAPSMVEFEADLEIFGHAVDDIINGRATPEEAMTQAQQQSDSRR